MPDDRRPFSRRFGYQPDEAPIKVRQDAPEDLRYAVVALGRDRGMDPSWLRDVVCDVLITRPDPSNWSEYPNVWGEVQSRLDSCPWYKVYDIAEAIHDRLRQFEDRALEYQRRLNEFFIERGIGWEMRDGEIIARGSEAFSTATAEAADALAQSGRQTAAVELHEAIRDISRRPEPDVTGAIQHAMAAVEIVARVVSRETKPTLGEVIKRYGAAIGVHPPLDEALVKLWGYASERGRHLREGRVPGFEEAELVVGIAAAICTYLTKKAGA